MRSRDLIYFKAVASNFFILLFLQRYFSTLYFPVSFSEGSRRLCCEEECVCEKK